MSTTKKNKTGPERTGKWAHMSKSTRITEYLARQKEKLAYEHGTVRDQYGSLAKEFAKQEDITYRQARKIRQLPKKQRQEALQIAKERAKRDDEIRRQTHSRGRGAKSGKKLRNRGYRARIKRAKAARSNT
jgi:hypothetical protein